MVWGCLFFSFVTLIHAFRLLFFTFYDSVVVVFSHHFSSSYRICMDASSFLFYPLLLDSPNLSCNLCYKPLL